MPLPVPCRIAFLPPTLSPSAASSSLALIQARLFAAVLADHLAGHPIVSVLDGDEQVLTDGEDVLVDAAHPDVEGSIDWLFRIARRDEVLWFELSLEPGSRRTPMLMARRPRGAVTEHPPLDPDDALSAQMSGCLDHWLEARRLPPAGPLPRFTVDDVTAVVGQIGQVIDAARPSPGLPAPAIRDSLLEPPLRLSAAFFRVLRVALSASLDPEQLDARLLQAEPEHLAARRNQLVVLIERGQGSPRELLSLAEAAPMDGKIHLGIRGTDVVGDRPGEGMALRHQGIAAQLMPSNPAACSNYARELARVGRLDEAQRWYQRAVMASPEFVEADIDALRIARDCQRTGATLDEANHRLGVLTEPSAESLLAGRRHLAGEAGMVIAGAHLDAGRLDEAVALAEQAVPALTGAPDAVIAAAQAELDAWKQSPAVLARTFGRDGFHRGELGRALTGLGDTPLESSEDVRLLLETLTALGRDDDAVVAVHHAAGAGPAGLLGLGKTRLAAAAVLMLAGDLDGALAHLQTVQLRRSQARLDTAINRVLRLAAMHSAGDWAAAVERLRERGARSLARAAARDLADFVPHMDRGEIRAALGEAPPVMFDPGWLDQLAVDLGLAEEVVARIDQRLAMPGEPTGVGDGSGPHASDLAIADRLADQWFMCVPPPTRDAALHASAVIYALGTALARYLTLASGPPTPLSGGYRVIAIEALHLCYRARFEVSEGGVRGLLAMLERIAVAPELLDPWLLRVERALDLEATWGGYLPYLTTELPRIRDLLRGDERIGWELRLAHDLRADPTQLEPAARLLARCAVAADDGAVFRIWSEVAGAILPPVEALDVQSICARAHPGTDPTPWLGLARAAFDVDRPDVAFDALCNAPPDPDPVRWRQALEAIQGPWVKADMDVPFEVAEARAAGRAAREAGDHERAIRCFRWCAVVDPDHADTLRELAAAHAAAGQAHAVIHSLARVSRDAAPVEAGTTLYQAQQLDAAAAVLRYASIRFRTVDEWRYLATAAWYAGAHEPLAHAYTEMLKLGATADAPSLHGLLTGLLGCGLWSEAEQVAQKLGAIAGSDPSYGALAAHGRARALCGLGRHGEALPWAEQAASMNRRPELADEMTATVTCARDGATPEHQPGRRTTPAGQALAALAAGDLPGARRLTSDAARTNWQLRTAHLVVAEIRADGDNVRTVSPAAVEVAAEILDRTAGAMGRDPTKARVRALRVMDDAFIHVDPPPALGPRVEPDAYRVELTRRRGG